MIIFVPCLVLDLNLVTPLVSIVLHSIYSMHVCTHWRLHKEHIYITVVVVIPTSTADSQRCFPGKLLARLTLCNAS